WAFSGFRTGEGADGPLPLGAGAQPQSCQACHMPSRDANGQPDRSKIAGIQELTNFPQAENVLPGEDINLKEREGFAQHTLVELHLLCVKMAQQSPDLRGTRPRHPMLTSKGLDPVLLPERKLAEQAPERPADIAITGVTKTAGALEARVTVTNKTGHK